MADVTTTAARGDFTPTVTGGSRGGSPITLDTLTRKLGQPGGGVPITPPNYGGPPSGTPANPPPTKGGTPIDRPWDPGNPVPPGPTTPPTNPKPPATDPAQRPPTNPDPPKGGSPGPSPTPMPDDGNFSKGQVRNEQLPGDIFSPFFESFYGDQGFNAYRGSNQGVPSGGRARTYDPLGIGADAYTNPDASYYGLEGVNSVLQPKGGARWGVVGGNGGFGLGMVGPDYTGPQFEDPRDVVKAMRRQRRKLNDVTKATYGGPGVVDGPGGFGPKDGTTTGSTAGGQDVNQKGGQPAANTGSGTAPPKGGQPGGTTSPTPDTSVLSQALPNLPAGQQYTDQFGNVISKEAYAQRLADFRQNGMGSLLSPDMFKTQFGTLTRDSGGNSNVFKQQGPTDNGIRYHWDQQNGWRQMAVDKYRGYGDYQYVNPTSSVENAKKAGAMSGDNRW